MSKFVKYKGEMLTLLNYKEPLKKIEKKSGYGYYGCLMATADGTKVQCHFCGKLFTSVSSHARQAHDISTREYKDKYQLAYTTSLVSEKERSRMKDITLNWLTSMTDEQKEEFKRIQKVRFAEYKKKRLENGWIQPKIQLETKNKRGTCPDQLLAKIKECAVATKKSPSKHEFVTWCGTQRYIHLIYKTFGSWEKAKLMLNLPKRITESNGSKTIKRYSDEELIEYLQMFYKETNKIPTQTDFRRGLLPNSALYVKRFGGIQKAREKAGIYHKPSKWDKK